MTRVLSYDFAVLRFMQAPRDAELQLRTQLK